MIGEASRRRLRGWALGLAAWGALAGSGCHFVTKASHAIPASRLDPSLFGCSREAEVPIQLASLGQIKAPDHILGAGDALAVYVNGVFPPGIDETPVLERFQTINQRYYPPHGSVIAPSTGLPVTINADGTVSLPLIEPLEAGGLTIGQFTKRIKEVYTNLGVLALGKEQVTVSLITPRVKRVMVIRQDTPNPQVALTPPGVVDEIHRGSGEVIDLPIYENDVLHALASTGGLPGTDGVREVWVMRNVANVSQTVGMEHLQSAIDGFYDGTPLPRDVIRIPLYALPGTPPAFLPEDVILGDGDVVFVPRRHEYFYTGGLLQGAKIPFPADEDLDVIEAIAMATNSVAGPAGQSGRIFQNGSPGYFLKPSRVIILRKLPDGSQLPIRVDLARALEDEKERILIQPDDVVMLNFKPTEATINVLANFFGSNIVLTPSN